MLIIDFQTYVYVYKCLGIQPTGLYISPFHSHISNIHTHTHTIIYNDSIFFLRPIFMATAHIYTRGVTITALLLLRFPPLTLCPAPISKFSLSSNLQHQYSTPLLLWAGIASHQNRSKCKKRIVQRFFFHVFIPPLHCASYPSLL